MNWPRDNDADLDAFYSRPDGSAAWEVQNLCYIFTPWAAYLAGTDVELKRGIRVHKKVAESLERIFASLWETCGKSQAEIEKLDLHQIGGAYYFRARRGSKRLSNHARGIAIDIDPADNAMRPGNRGDMSMIVIAAFEKEGWRWGGVYGDPMHFEAVDNGKPKATEAPLAPLAVQPVHTGMKDWIAVATPLIKRWEDFRAEPYWDFGQWSNGYGQGCDQHAAPITEEQASARLAAYLADLVEKIAPLIKVRIAANQGASLLSFAYNLGHAALGKSTLLKLLNNADALGAASEFRKWNKSGGKVLPGLVMRRAVEAELFSTP